MSALASHPKPRKRAAESAPAPAPAPSRQRAPKPGALTVRWIIRGVFLDDAGAPAFTRDLRRAAILEWRIERPARRRRARAVAALLFTAADAPSAITLASTSPAPGARLIAARSIAWLDDAATGALCMDIDGLFSATLVRASKGGRSGASWRLLHARTSLLSALGAPGGRAELQGAEVDGAAADPARSA